MNKNGQYVGVDEKYIPEEEKYVDNTLNSEIKGALNDGVKSVKNYVSKDENKEKIKNVGKQALKVGKGIAIGYVASWIIGVIIVFIIIITALIMIIKNANSMDDDFDKIYDSAEKRINNAFNEDIQ